MKFLAAVFLACLTTTGAKAQDAAQIDWSRRSVFLIGDHSNVPGTVVFAFPGNTKNDRFKVSMFTPVRANKPSQDGYFVGVAKGDEQIGIDSIALYTTGYLRDGYSLELCGGKPTPVFRANPGQIIYVTDLYFQAEDASAGKKGKYAKYITVQNVEAARAWVQKHYPNDTKRFVVAPALVLPTASKCHG